MIKKIMAKKYLWVFLLATFVLSLDLLSKYLIVYNFAENETKQIIPGFFNLVLVYNTGVAFSLFSDSGTAQNMRMAGLAFVALIPLSYFLYQAKNTEKLFLIGLALIFGGALGNIHDRFKWGAVVDFLEFYLSNLSWPAFNVADIAVCVGVGFLIIATFFEKDKKSEKNKE